MFAIHWESMLLALSLNPGRLCKSLQSHLSKTGQRNVRLTWWMALIHGALFTCCFFIVRVSCELDVRPRRDQGPNWLSWWPALSPRCLSDLPDWSLWKSGCKSMGQSSPSAVKEVCKKDLVAVSSSMRFIWPALCIVIIIACQPLPKRPSSLGCHGDFHRGAEPVPKKKRYKWVILCESMRWLS